MLSPREHPSCWHRVKAPAAVSLACLAATLLIAAQGFRGHPITKHSNLPAQHTTEPLRHEDALSQREVEQDAGASQLRFKQSQEDETGTRSKKLDSRVGLSTSTSNTGAGSHKQRTFEYVEISTTGVENSLQTENLTATSQSSDINAYREEHDGMEVVIINKTMNGRTPNGLLLIFHGCSHSGLDFWYPSSSCPNCTGLPEEVSVTKAALKRDFAVLAFSSLDRGSAQCWDVTYGAEPVNSIDLKTVLSVWQLLSEREGWSKIPRYALGGSSGGAFVLNLALRLPLDGVIPIIMAVKSSLLETKPASQDQAKTWPFPPTIFIHMPRDTGTAQGVASNAATLKKQGVLVQEIGVGERSINSTFFADRIEGIDNSTSTDMYQALMSEGCLNATGYLVDSPRSSAMKARWQKALRENVAACKSMSFKADTSPVFEELNLAWAGHELVSDYTDACLDWFSSISDGPKLMSAVNPRF